MIAQSWARRPFSGPTRSALTWSSIALPMADLDGGNLGTSSHLLGLGLVRPLGLLPPGLGFRGERVDEYAPTPGVPEP